jgi:hypothetical protein
MQQNNETENLQLTSSSAPNDRTPPDPTTPASLPPQAFNPVVLEVQHAQAVREIEDQRAQHGQLTTGINAEVGASILTAGKLSLAKSNTGERETGPSTQFVVAAPPGTGKTSHAIALMIAVVRIASVDPTKPSGCLFVVDQIKKADDIWRQIEELLPGEVAVWTSDHDVGCRKPERIIPVKKYRVDDLEHHPIAIVTQAFLRGPRGDKARWVDQQGHKAPRALTIFDEQTKEVEVYDVQFGDVSKVKEAIERRREWALLIVPKMLPLLDFCYGQSRRSLDDQPAHAWETPADDPLAWGVASDLDWFTTEFAEQYVRSNASEINKLEQVFGLAAQMARNCAFIYRRGGGENGTHFVGYVPAPTPTTSSILLDATSDIDGVIELCGWCEPVDVPQVRYDNLHVVHAEPYKGDKSHRTTGQARRAQALCKLRQATDLGDHASRRLWVGGLSEALGGPLNLIPDVTTGDPKSTRYPWNLDGRHLDVTYWGGHGIGANDWKDAEFVFEFGEHFLPRRTLVGMMQGLLQVPATQGILAADARKHMKSKVDAFSEGHLLRMMKQLGMRGKARRFDKDGVCGPQVLVLTCDFKRLLMNAHRLFPGATLSKWGRTSDHFRHITQSEMLLEMLTEPDLPDTISANEMAQRMGCKAWRTVSTNAMTDEVKRALPNLGWKYQSKSGPKGRLIVQQVRRGYLASTGVAKEQRLNTKRLPETSQRSLVS